MKSRFILSDTSVVPGVLVRYGIDAENGASFSYVKDGDPGPRFDSFIVKEPSQSKRVVALDN